MRRRVNLPPLCREKYEHIHTAVVSHKATIRLVISSLLGFDPRGFRDRLDQSPAMPERAQFQEPSARG